MTASDQIKVLNIIGCGRSGSTILANTLGQVPGYVHVGELGYLWNRGVIHNVLCGCGQPFRECEFWQSIIERSGLPVDQKTATRLASFPRRANRRMMLAVLGRRGPYGMVEGIEEYADALRALYRALHAETGCVVIDSTKAPAHSYLLQAAPELDPSAVHLVRDARAVAYSWGRRDLRFDWDPKNPRPKIHSPPPRTALKWAYANLTAELLRKRLGERMLTVRYEDFVDAPRQTISQILRLVGRNSGVTPFVSEREVRLETTHTVWGNRSRMRTGVVELRRDSEWEESMSPLSRAAVTGLTWPLLRKYAYGDVGSPPATAGAGRGTGRDPGHPSRTRH